MFAEDAGKMKHKWLQFRQNVLETAGLLLDRLTMFVFLKEGKSTSFIHLCQEMFVASLSDVIFVQEVITDDVKRDLAWKHRSKDSSRKSGLYFSPKQDFKSRSFPSKAQCQ